MSFTVRCPHCDTLLKVPDKYHYQTIPCPNCKKEIEAISLETLEVGKKFLEEIENMESDMIIDESSPPSSRPPAPEDGEEGDDIPRLRNH